MSNIARRAAILAIVGAGTLATAYVLLLLRRRKRQPIDTVDKSTTQIEEAPSTLTAPAKSPGENTVNNCRADTQIQVTNAKSRANRRKRFKPQVTFEDDNQPSTSAMAEVATPVSCFIISECTRS